MSRLLIEKFYNAFQNKDWKTMQTCYHDDAKFHDPVFEDLTAKQVRAMWHMLLQANGSIGLTYDVLNADDERGACRWAAKYQFSRTGRDVHNIIEAKFEFKAGKFLVHRDDFDLWRWAGMALGAPGKILGWTPFMRNKIRATAQKGLFRFIAEHPDYQ